MVERMSARFGWKPDIRTRFLRELGDWSPPRPGPRCEALEFRSTAVTRADKGSVPRLSVMIRLTRPDPHLLTQSEERSAQQTKSEQKKNAGSVFVLQAEKRARKSYN